MKRDAYVQNGRPFISRYPLDPPPPHAVTGGGRSNLAFLFFSISVFCIYLTFVYFPLFIYSILYCTVL